MARACRDDLPDGVSEIFFARGLARPSKSSVASSQSEATRVRFEGGSGPACQHDHIAFLTRCGHMAEALRYLFMAASQTEGDEPHGFGW